MMKNWKIICFTFFFLVSNSLATASDLKIILPIEGQILFTDSDSAPLTVRTISKPENDNRSCLWLKLDKDPDQETSTICSSDDDPYFHASGIPIGIHEIIFVKTTSGGIITEALTSEFEVQAVEPAEFLPTYEWQIVPSSASVPPGLEIQLPLDDFHQKVARIPPVWRLQNYIEDGPKEGFFRVDISLATTVQDLLSQVCSWANMASDCESSLEMFNHSVHPQLSCKEINLFQYQDLLKFHLPSAQDS